MIKSVTPGGVTTLYEYDAIGRQTKQATDMNGNGEIDAADLVTATAYSYGTQDGKNSFNHYANPQPGRRQCGDFSQ